MRALAAGFVAVAFGAFLAVGCGSSAPPVVVHPPPSTGGNTTGGTTGGTSTGGTTGGTGGLADGTACSANSQCQSAVCGINGSGNCCTAACSTTDPTCGASGCDSLGVCTYPTTAATCGTACTGNMLTTSACNGSGACAAGTPVACANNLGCNSAGTGCLTTCTSLPTDCASGYWCNNGSCAPQQATGACTLSSACVSLNCAGGFCCASTTACSAGNNQSCSFTGCDMTTGACVYPPTSTLCGASSCSGQTLTTYFCGGNGQCVDGGMPCPNNLTCANSLTCVLSCSGTPDCSPGYWCNAGTCVLLLDNGAVCGANATCTSNVCGTTGTGHCCAKACPAANNAACGATDCDGTGSCVYPPATTSCDVASCASSFLNTYFCDGNGTCVDGGSVCNGNFHCAGSTCAAACTTTSDCGSGTFCDTPAGSCCATIANPGTVNVDIANGSDTTACCGYSGAGPCQTLEHAMLLVDATNGLNAGTLVTLDATVDGGGGNWSTTVETYPISLGWGVTLTAPGVYFKGSNSAEEIFDIAMQPGELAPPAMVTMQGGAVNAVVVGSDDSAAVTTQLGIVVEDGGTLNVSYVDVFVYNGSTGITLENGATLDLDFASAGGFLNLGGTLPNGTVQTENLGTGIYCSNATISDLFSTASPSLAAKAQYTSIDAEDGCTVSLMHNPTFGWPTAGGYTGSGQGCTGISGSKDYIGLSARGGATVSLSNATFTCMYEGLTVNPGATTNPTVTLSNATIENCSPSGIYVTAGTVTVSSGTIDHNYIGVEMAGSGYMPSVTLNDGTMTNNTTVTCNSNQEPGATSQPNPGIDVYNDSDGNVAADYVNWDEWSNTDGVDLFWCAPLFGIPSNCTCQATNNTCTNTAGDDDMDLVMGGDGGAITGSETSTNGASANSGCN